MASLDDVAEYFLLLDDASEGDGLSNLKLQKLVYYAQGFYGAIFGRPLFQEDIEAWVHGPVAPVLYHKYKKFGSNRIDVPEDFDKKLLTRDESELIEEVFEVFGQYSAWKLRNMTHEEKPWVSHEKYAEVIPFDEMKEYFKNRIE